MKVAFLGLGAMGLPMAKNLFAASHDVFVWNRTIAKADGLGPLVEKSVAHAARDAEVVVTMLSDDAAVRSVASELMDAMPRGAIHLSCSTISAALSRELAKEHNAHNQGYVAAPVFGRPEAAAAAKLFFVVSGHEAAIDRCKPIFDALGQGVARFGSDPDAANVVKLMGNFMLASTIETFAEAAALLRRRGVEPAQFLEIMNALFKSPILENYGGMIVRESHEPGFKLRLGLKDVRLALAAAEESSVAMPVASAIRDQLIGAMAAGMSELDWSALGKLAKERAGSET